jgi:hypothetical protein
MRNPDVSVSQIVAVKLAVRLAAELTRSLIHSRETAHHEHRQAGDLSALDRAMFIELAASATLTAIGGGVVVRWIATGNGPGVRTLVLLV